LVIHRVLTIYTYSASPDYYARDEGSRLQCLPTHGKETKTQTSLGSFTNHFATAEINDQLAFTPTYGCVFPDNFRGRLERSEEKNLNCPALLHSANVAARTSY